MRKGLLFVGVVVVLGCTPVAEEEDDFSDLEGGEEKADFASKVKVFGDTAYGQVSYSDYSGTPRYGALRFRGNKGDEVIAVVSGVQARAWLATSSFTNLAFAKGQYASVSARLPKTGTYYVVFRTKDQQASRFWILLGKKGRRFDACRGDYECPVGFFCNAEEGNACTMQCEHDYGCPGGMEWGEASCTCEDLMPEPWDFLAAMANDLGPDFQYRDSPWNAYIKEDAWLSDDLMNHRHEAIDEASDDDLEVSHQGLRTYAVIKFGTFVGFITDAPFVYQAPSWQEGGVLIYQDAVGATVARIVYTP